MADRFCLQMVSCGDGCGAGNDGSENVYSTEETICGTWIDGKPIYRKVISGPLAIESGNALVFANVSDLQIDQLINLHGTMTNKAGTGQAVFPASYNRTNGLFGAINMYYDNERVLYHFLNNNGIYSEGLAYVVIEYTKQ